MPHLTDAAQDKQRISMIRQALKDKAPLTYKRLKATGELEAFLKSRDEIMLASYQDSRIQYMAVPKDKIPQTYLDNLQHQTQARNRAWEETLETFLDFSDPEPEPTM